MLFFVELLNHQTQTNIISTDYQPNDIIGSDQNVAAPRNDNVPPVRTVADHLNYKSAEESDNVGGTLQRQRSGSDMLERRKYLLYIITNIFLTKVAVYLLFK